ncbi:hypothetical protein BC826DRAFT_974438 [Russula brevipes]|nr:hypothetical protein BC826DRAFT_974438 [Russula brevipes]
MLELSSVASSRRVKIGGCVDGFEASNYGKVDKMKLIDSKRREAGTGGKGGRNDLYTPSGGTYTCRRNTREAAKSPTPVREKSEGASWVYLGLADGHKILSRLAYISSHLVGLGFSSTQNVTWRAKTFPLPGLRNEKTNFTSSLSFRTGTYPRLGPGQHSGTLYASVRLRLSVLVGVLSVPLTPAPNTALLSPTLSFATCHEPTRCQYLSGFASGDFDMIIDLGLLRCFHHPLAGQRVTFGASIANFGAYTRSTARRSLPNRSDALGFLVVIVSEVNADNTVYPPMFTAHEAVKWRPSSLHHLTRQLASANGMALLHKHTATHVPSLSRITLTPSERAIGGRRRANLTTIDGRGMTLFAKRAREAHPTPILHGTRNLAAIEFLLGYRGSIEISMTMPSITSLGATGNRIHRHLRCTSAPFPVRVRKQAKESGKSSVRKGRDEARKARGGKTEKGKGKKRESSEHAKAFKDSVRRVREQGDRRVMLCRIMTGWY